MMFQKVLGGLAACTVGLLLMACAQATESTALLASINSYRADAQHCDGRATVPLTPFVWDARLQRSGSTGADWQQALAHSGYPMAHAKAISLSGPQEVQAVMTVLQLQYCAALLDPKFTDIGIYQAGQQWRIVLARPLLRAHQGDWQTEGQSLLTLVNQARAQGRQCGAEYFKAAPKLSWSALLGGVAEAHSRYMANANVFSHRGLDGSTPGDRAELAGYSGVQVGESIAAGLDTPRKVLEGWLASPGHCANLMRATFRELGAAYAVDPSSDAGIYWTAMFGAP